MLGLAGSARAATVSLGPGGGVGLSGSGAPTTVHLRVLVSGERAAFDFSGREGWVNGGDARSLGSLFFGGRFSPAALDGQRWVRLGFLHHHETPAAVVREEPAQSFAGTAELIRHRSGLELGVGGGLPVGGPRADGRVRADLDLSVGLLPDDKGPAAYGLLEFTFMLTARTESSG